MLTVTRRGSYNLLKAKSKSSKQRKPTKIYKASVEILSKKLEVQKGQSEESKEKSGISEGNMQIDSIRKY